MNITYGEPDMPKATQVFRNSTDKPMYIVLEPCTPRYRLAPGDEVLLSYNPTPLSFNPYGAPVVVDVHEYRGGVGLVVWTGEDELLTPAGLPAQMAPD